MDASRSPHSPSSSAPILPSIREGSIRQYDSDPDKPASSIELDEKRDLRRSSSESTTSLLLKARDLEAQLEPIAAPPEDLISRRTKIIFVTLYFFLNLSLTLSNKSVLSHVSALLFVIRPGSVQVSIEGTPVFKPWILTNTSPAEPAVATHNITYRRHVNRYFHLDGNGPSDFDATEPPLTPDPPRIFPPLHSQHRDLQCLSRHGLRPVPSSHAIHLSSRHHPHLPHGLRSHLQQHNLLLPNPIGTRRRTSDSRRLPGFPARRTPHPPRHPTGLHQNHRHQPPIDRPSLAISHGAPPPPLAYGRYPMHGIRLPHR
jgi:hypothetical protein